MMDLIAEAESPTFQILTSSISPWKNRPVPPLSAPIAQLVLLTGRAPCEVGPEVATWTPSR